MLPLTHGAIIGKGIDLLLQFFLKDRELLTNTNTILASIAALVEETSAHLFMLSIIVSTLLCENSSLKNNRFSL
jgi:hypothetical protein